MKQVLKMPEKEVRQEIDKNPADIVLLARLYAILVGKEDIPACLDVEDRILNLADNPTTLNRALWDALLLIPRLTRAKSKSLENPQYWRSSHNCKPWQKERICRRSTRRRYAGGNYSESSEEGVYLPSLYSLDENDAYDPGLVWIYLRTELLCYRPPDPEICCLMVEYKIQQCKEYMKFDYTRLGKEIPLDADPLDYYNYDGTDPFTYPEHYTCFCDFAIKNIDNTRIEFLLVQTLRGYVDQYVHTNPFNFDDSDLDDDDREYYLGPLWQTMTALYNITRLNNKPSRSDQFLLLLNPVLQGVMKWIRVRPSLILELDGIVNDMIASGYEDWLWDRRYDHAAYYRDHTAVVRILNAPSETTPKESTKYAETEKALCEELGASTWDSLKPLTKELLVKAELDYYDRDMFFDASVSGTCALHYYEACWNEYKIHIHNVIESHDRGKSPQPQSKTDLFAFAHRMPSLTADLFREPTAVIRVFKDMARLKTLYRNRGAHPDSSTPVDLKQCREFVIQGNLLRRIMEASRLKTRGNP
jgi:hypothetical protein